MIASPPTTVALPSTFSGYTPPPKFPSWKQIKEQQWKEILTRYAEGARDRETVCARTAYVVALKACKGWRAGSFDSFDELVSEGYAYALSRYGDYDPTKASSNGIAGFLYKSTLLTLRKTAQERFTFHGKRKHNPTDVVPTIVLTGDVEQATRSGSAATKPAQDSDTILPAASIRGPATSYVKAPHSPSEQFLEHAANEQLRIRISDLLMLLPKKQADLVALHFGVNGVDRERTVKELARDEGCSVRAMYRRLEQLLDELLRRAKAAGI